MEQLIKKYRARLRELKQEYKKHREKDVYKVYIYGKILTYELVLRDLRELRRKEDDERGNN